MKPTAITRSTLQRQTQELGQVTYPKPRRHEVSEHWDLQSISSWTPSLIGKKKGKISKNVNWPTNCLCVPCKHPLTWPISSLPAEPDLTSFRIVSVFSSSPQSKILRLHPSPDRCTFCASALWPGTCPRLRASPRATDPSRGSAPSGAAPRGGRGFM